MDSEHYTKQVPNRHQINLVEGVFIAAKPNFDAVVVGFGRDHFEELRIVASDRLVIELNLM